MLETLMLTLAAPAIDPLLDDLSRRAVSFFWEQSHPETGMTLDRADNTADKPKDEMVASVAAVGFALSAYAIGAERGWLKREDALARTQATIAHLEKLPLRNRGWFVHFYDWETGKRLWNSETSSIDTGIMLAGLLQADAYWQDPEVRAGTQRIVSAIDWNWMMTDGGNKPDSKTFSMGWKPESGFIEARWDHYNELILLYIIALGASPQVPDASWDAWKREPIVNYGPYEFFTGGPLFLHQMSNVFYDLEGKRDRLGWDYWKAGWAATMANRQYCIDNPKGFVGYSADVWGLSASDGPDGYVAYGAPTAGPDDGTLAPSSAVAALLYDKEIALQAAYGFKKNHPEAFGRYGFNIALNPTKKWMSPDVIGIDLGQMMLAIENHRDGLPHRLSASHPIVQKGMSRIGFQRTFEGPIAERPLRRQ